MRVIFFCGHKSPYGLVHLEPLVQSKFEIIAIVLATNKRWGFFREKLLGKAYYHSKNSTMKRVYQGIKVMIKKIIPEVMVRILKGNHKKLDEIERISKKYKVPFWYIDDINSQESIQKFKDSKPDLFFCAAYPQILSKELISIPSRGSVNFHPSLLPKYRGAHPHYWVIVKGEQESGLSAHFMTDRIDDGPIIAQLKFPICDYNYKQLYEKIVMETANFVKKVELFFLKGKNYPLKQNSSRASYFRNDREIHHRIFWNIYTANEMYNLIRGGNAFCFFRNGKIIFEKCFISKTNRNLTNKIVVENGVIVDLGKDYISIYTKSGIVNIQELRYNCRYLLAPQFISKYKPLIGEKFG